MTDRPTADQVRDYLRATGWTEQPPGEAGSLWTYGRHGKVGLVEHPNDLDIVQAVQRIANNEGRPYRDVDADILASGAAPVADHPRLFRLMRDVDPTGVSGPGHVADGVQWADGTVTLRWHGEHASTVCWASLDDARAVHGHGGATRFVFDDEMSPFAGFFREPTDEEMAALESAFEEAQGKPHVILPDNAYVLRRRTPEQRRAWLLEHRDDAIARGIPAQLVDMMIAEAENDDV